MVAGMVTLRLIGERTDALAVLAVLAMQADVVFDGFVDDQGDALSVRVHAQVRAPRLISDRW